jgi:hypothetical protein
LILVRWTRRARVLAWGVALRIRVFLGTFAV